VGPRQCIIQLRALIQFRLVDLFLAQKNGGCFAAVSPGIIEVEGQFCGTPDRQSRGTFSLSHALSINQDSMAAYSESD
jgi:hypothetical protein